jgi:hypothetical protein
MEDILCIEKIVDHAPTIHFLNIFNVNMLGVVDPHKVVAWRNTFLTFANEQNESVSKVQRESFGHGRLKHPFSQVEGDLNL